jgi:hypothetical protein
MVVTMPIFVEVHCCQQVTWVNRFGANVVIGKPIPFTSLPADVHAATEVVRQEIARLVEQAKQL